MTSEDGLNGDSSTPTRLLVIGGSAGALGPLTRLAEGLPARDGLAVLVVVHRRAGSPTVLPSILKRHSVYRTAEPSNGDPLLPNYIYIAPSDRHLEVGHGVITTNRGPRVNGQRPAIDVLFDSAAVAYGPAVVGAVLSGNLDDGASGLNAIRRAGGQAIVQDPDDAEYSDMPRAAIERAGPVVVAPADRLAEALLEALRRPVAPQAPAPVAAPTERAPLGAGDEPGSPIGVTCPECGGTLWLTGEGDNPVLSCRIGHRMSPATLGVMHSERLEKALWAALRSLEEEVAVASFLEDMSRRHDDLEVAERHRQQRVVAARQTEILRRFLLRMEPD